MSYQRRADPSVASTTSTQYGHPDPRTFEAVPDRLFHAVDPGWSLKAQGLRRRRSLIGLIFANKAYLEAAQSAQLTSLVRDLIDVEQDVFGETAGDLEILLPDAARDDSSGFLVEVAGGEVRSTTYAGRIANVDEEWVGAVLTKVGATGSRGDDFVAYLPIVRFPMTDRARLQIGALFDWTHDEVIGPDGRSSTISELRLLPDEPFTSEERARIERESEQLLAYVTRREHDTG